MIICVCVCVCDLFYDPIAFSLLPTYRVFDHAVFYVNNVRESVSRWRCWCQTRGAPSTSSRSKLLAGPRATCPPGGVARLSMSERGVSFSLPYDENGGGMYPCRARNSAESHRSFVPLLHVSRRRVLRDVEREREIEESATVTPFSLRATTALPLTRPPISPHPAQIPPSCTMCRVRDGSAGNAGRPSRGLTFSIIFMW